MILVFDLDDTLYPEIDYVHSGFLAVADAMGDRYGWDKDASLAFMIEVLRTKGRGAVFDSLLAHHSMLSRKSVHECVAIYRHHQPIIKLSPESDAFLSRWQVRPYLVTDGHKVVQANKIEALGLWDRFQRVFITHRYGLQYAKPSPYCFDLIRRAESCDWSDLIYIGDNPVKDFVSLNTLGCKTVRVLTGEHCMAVAQPGYDAQYRIENLLCLEQLILSLS